ncbi:hypothetical protein BCR34DRAFT_631839 [Clohesyomyces aquaticus]|uniref:Rhodopsin domain-containing protein n=1 Tax=Clohesyomyces aquaticus TaxID=1231657 RepID=A0A1Y1ZA29_9PLEO|nr:hypothetical protein BCR34DRAFT_631839 [Clohesyomyces aquaticus]
MDQIPPEVLAVLKNEDKGPTTIGVCTVFTVLALISVCLRFFTRIKLVGNVWLEDHFIAASMVRQVHYDNGKHIMFVPLPHIVQILKYLFISIEAYCSALTLTKVSILLQYRRIFTVKELRIPIYIVMGICVAYGVESVLSGVFTCIPVDAFWEISKKPTAKCINEYHLWYANGGLNIFTDLLVAALPVHTIWGLQMARKQKIALTAILTLGWFVCIVSILRLNSLVSIVKHPEDNTWYSPDSVYWSSIECNLAIVCASTPALKPLIVRIIPRFGSRLDSNGKNSKDSKSSKGSKGSKNSEFSKQRNPFIELKDKASQGTIRDDLERGDKRYEISALPAYGLESQKRSNIHVTGDFEQHFEEPERRSESGSQKNLVSGFPRVYPTSGR